MSFYIRLYSKEKKILSKENLYAAIQGNQAYRDIFIEKEITSTHNQFLVKKNELELAIILELIPKDKVEDRSKVFKISEGLSGKKPLSAVKWLGKYLKQTEVLYEFIPLLNAETDKDWELLSLLYQEAWLNLRGIFQIKNEGFTNESGDIILWDFPSSAAGTATMAVKTYTGRWKTFIMNLESMEQRKSFFRGKIPKNSKLIFRG